MDKGVSDAYFLNQYKNFQEFELTASRIQKEKMEFISESLQIRSKNNFLDLLAKFRDDSWPKVFSHNDFYYLNVLADKEEQGRLHLIDFEFVCPNIMGWDLAHYLVEGSFFTDLNTGVTKLRKDMISDTNKIQKFVDFYLSKFIGGNKEGENVF